MEFSIFQVDAFTSNVFGGNPAAVVPLENWLSDDILQKIATENNLSETAFFVEQAGEVRLRWFTPVYEVNLCGHATLATAHVWFKHLGITEDRVVFQSKSGPLTVVKTETGYQMDFPVDELQTVDPPSSLISGIGHSPAATFRGRDDYMVVLEREELVANLKPDFNAISQLEDNRGVIVTAPGNQVDFVSRCFFPNAGINEDPVTGSAHTTMTPYWSEKLGKTTLSAKQISARGGELECTLNADRVLLSGKAVTYMTGTIII